MKLALYLPRCLQRINLPFLEYKDKKLESLLQMSRRLSMRMETLASASANWMRLYGVCLGACPAPWRFAGGLTGGDKWRPVNKKKASAFLSTQEPNYLASGNIKQKLMSTTKVVKEIEKLQGTEDAPLVASGKLRSADNERVLNQIDQRRINLAEVAYLDLELATKVVKELEISFCLICPQLRRVDC